MAIRQPASFEIAERIVRVAGQHQPLLNELFGLLYAYKLATRATIHRDDLVVFIKEWWLAKALAATSSTELYVLDSAVHAAMDIFNVPVPQVLYVVTYEAGRVATEKYPRLLHDALHHTTMNELQLGLRDVYEAKQDRKIISESGYQISTTFYRAN